MQTALELGSLSIGALSRASGVPPETLRTWERRYGFPTPARTPSGHRRYALATLTHLRLVQRALALGQKPSVALRLPREELQRALEALGSHDAAKASTAPASATPTLALAPDALFEPWFAAVQRFDAAAFDAELRRAQAQLGTRVFVHARVAPFVALVGARWARGALRVAHEHFASERLQHMLHALRGELAPELGRGAVVCATLPGEQHLLGLHMVALVAAIEGYPVRFLGANTPVEDIAAAASGADVHAVLISAACSADRAQLCGHVEALRARLPDAALVLGGAGFLGFEGPARYLPSLQALSEWLAASPA